MGRLFGTDGVRGIAGEDMTWELAMNLSLIHISEPTRRS